MVALRRIPRDIPPPIPDGRPYRSVHEYAYLKAYYWGGFVNAAARATKNVRAFAGRRACVDLFSSVGVNYVEETRELAWGSSLLALHAQDPFDLCIFNDRSKEATSILAERIADPRYFNLPVFSLDLGSETAGDEVRKILGERTDGTKVVVMTGDANDAPVFVKMLLPAWEGHRYALTLIDPPGADFWWESLGMLTLQERMDLMLLFPEDMDIERNLPIYAAQEPGTSKLDRYMPSLEWRDLAVDPNVRRIGPALRSLYKKGLRKELGYRYLPSRDRAVKNSKNSEIYKLIFASKHSLGLKIWDSVNKDEPDGQIGFPLDVYT